MLSYQNEGAIFWKPIYKVRGIWLNKYSPIFLDKQFVVGDNSFRTFLQEKQRLQNFGSSTSHRSFWASQV